MFFILSKTLGFFALPSNLVALLAALGVVLMCDALCAAPGGGSRVSVVLLLAIAGLLAARQCARSCRSSSASRRGTPGRAARRPASSSLGGALEPGRVAGARRGRAQRSGRAHHRDRRARAALPRRRASCSAAASRPPDLCRRHRSRARARACSRASASPRERITLEDKSRNTVENARFTKALVHPKPGERWLLVTSALPHAARGRRLSPRPAFRSRPFRSTTARAARSTCCGRSRSLSDGLRRTDTADARMGRARGLSAHRAEHGPVSRAVRLG